MYKLKESKTAKAVAGFVGLVTALMMMGPLVASADAVSDLQAQIAALMVQINALNAQVTAAGGSGSCAYTFATNLKQGQTGADVMNLQKVFNMSADTQVSASGAGSPGSETSYFGPATFAAAVKFQNKYASEILAPVGLTSGTGFVGASTRAKLNAMCTTTTTTPTTPTTPGVSGSLMVSNTTQPGNSLMVEGSARVPFTKFVVTAGASDVTITGVNVERSGLAQDIVFAGIVLLDEDGTQIGIAKTLGSNHTATVGETFTVKAGTSKTLTIAGNAPTGTTALDAYAGQVASLTVTGINTTSTVSGSFPITGAMHTINASLTIGAVTTAVSSFDPSTSASKEIGTTGYKFAGIRVTAGSAEAVRIKSIRWNQSGSASSNDLSNVMVYVDGTAYPTTVSADGKYYTANLGSGIVMDKGLSKDIYVQGDIVGSGSANRTVKFDVYKTTDLYLTGETYGYGITPPAGSGTAADATSEFTATTPWFDGSKVTINAGSITSIAKATSVAAQNIALNVSNQVLGGYEADIKGESISVQSSVFHITNTGTQTLLTSVSLYNANGAVVAGPVDAVAEAGLNQKVTFTDTITYPVGKGIYTLKGKVPSTTANGVTLIASTTPSTDWTSVTGQTTGNTITLTNGLVTMNTMTVKSAALAITMSTTPAAQTIVAGSTGVTFANIQLDASQSGEDVRFSSIALTKSAFTGLTTCQLFDGASALNSTVLNPAATTAETITFDASLTVAKNTVKTLALKCNVTSSATGAFTWTVTPSSTNPTVTGVTSGSSVTATGAAATSLAQTVGTGTLTVALDASSPAYTIATAGTTGVTLGAYRFTATNDAVNLARIGLSMGLITASSTAAELTQVTLWNGNTQVGTAEFVGTSRTATSTLSTPVLVPKDGSVVITVKGDLATQGASAASHPGALLTVDIGAQGSAGNSNNTAGTGVGSGTTIDSTGTTAVSGVRVFKTAPTVAKQTSGMSSTLIAQSGIDLYRFSINANAKNDLALNKLVVNVATSSASTANGTTTVTNLKVYAYTDSAFSTTVGGSFTAGQVVATIAGLVSNGNNAAALSSILTIPASQTYYFKVVGDVTQVAGTTGSAGTVSTKIVGDSAYDAAGTLAGLMAVYTSGLGNFVWSPLSTSTTASLVNADWTNGYQVTGLPSGGTDSFTLTK